MSKVSVACVLISFISMLNIIGAASAATMQQNFNKTSQKPNDNRNSPSECIIYAATTDWLKLEAVVSIYSTFSYESHCPDDGKSLKQASLEAQLKGIQSVSLGVVNAGRYFSAADQNLSTVPNPFVYFGNVKYSKIGEVRIGLYGMFLARGAGAPSGLIGLSNTYYTPIEYLSNIFNIWNAGTLVHILIAPNGDSYILSQFTDRILTWLNRENASELKDLLNLPSGWQFQNMILSDPVSVRANVQNDFKSQIVVDQFYNIYIKFKEGGLETP